MVKFWKRAALIASAGMLMQLSTCADFEALGASLISEVVAAAIGAGF